MVSRVCTHASWTVPSGTSVLAFAIRDQRFQVIRYQTQTKSELECFDLRAIACPGIYRVTGIALGRVQAIANRHALDAAEKARSHAIKGPGEFDFVEP